MKNKCKETEMRKRSRNRTKNIRKTVNRKGAIPPKPCSAQIVTHFLCRTFPVHIQKNTPC